jgi:acyl carrier protein
MSNVLNISVDSIKNSSSPDNIESWDSLKHMNLIIALEEEFEIQFNDSEIVDSMSYALILDILKNK